MTLPGELFHNPVLTALQTSHAHLAVAAGEAVRYPSAVTPFAAIVSPTQRALGDLSSMLDPGEFVWVTALGESDPAAAQLRIQTSIDVLQMLLPTDVYLPPPHIDILPLDCLHAAEMVALTEIAFPGFFRPRTCEMGDYYGIRSAASRELIAMAGERLTFPGYAEISGICTHPDHRGRGYAAALTRQVARHQREQGIVSWLHVSASNQRAIALYLSLGFEIVRSIPLTQLCTL